MALLIDWIGALAAPPYKAVVTIPQADLTLISGSLYELDTLAFFSELKALEASEEGMPFGDLMSHNADYTVAGTTYADALLMLCQVQFEDTGSAYSVRLAGTNNDIFDVESGILIPTPLVTVIAQNAAGLVVVESVSSADITALLAAQNLTNEQAEGEHITQASVAPMSQPDKVIIRNTTTLKRWEADAWEDEAATIGYRGKGLEKVGMLAEVVYS